MNDELKQLFAKLLPEWVYLHDGYEFCQPVKILCWLPSPEGDGVLDTELLYLCHLIEHDHLTEDEHRTFAKRVKVSATWQQRVTALAKVKGVTL